LFAENLQRKQQMSVQRKLMTKAKTEMDGWMEEAVRTSREET